MGGVPGTLPDLGIDGLQRRLEENVRHGASAIVIDDLEQRLPGTRLVNAPVTNPRSRNR